VFWHEVGLAVAVAATAKLLINMPAKVSATSAQKARQEVKLPDFFMALPRTNFRRLFSGKARQAGRDAPARWLAWRFA
jgi:hypothetical protein